MELKAEPICECGCFKFYHIHYGFDGSEHLMNCRKCDCKKFKSNKQNSPSGVDGE